MDKQTWRKRMISMRDALTPEERQERSQALCQQIIDEVVRPRAPVSLTAFYPFASEVDLVPALLSCQELGAEVWLPRTSRTQDGALQLLWGRLPKPVIKDQLDVPIRYEPGSMDGFLLDQGWARSRYGIIEPPLPSCQREIVPELVLLPAVAVDLYGNRIGYGAGFYDRFLAGLPTEVLVVAVVFEVQVTDERLPTEAHDRPYDLLVTGLGVRPAIRPSRF